jgi:ATP-dependent exoDNAse (exonuclease V) beta subunit
MRAEEFVDVDDVKRLSRTAAAMYLRLRRRADLQTLFAGAQVHYEVPFSLQLPDLAGAVVRGRIDCLAVRPDGSAVVIEFKTGAPSPAHEAQAALYCDAIRAMAPGREVRSALIYPHP